MAKRFAATIVLLLVISPALIWAAPPVVRVSVFNFGTVNIDASGLGATVTNMLLGLLAEDRSLSLLDRKELESFLSMNDLQQNDQLDNVLTIGDRLGLNVIVVGTVEKKGAVIVVQCKAIQIAKKRVILTDRIGTIGESALNSEIRQLSDKIKKAIREQSGGEKTAEVAVFSGPAGLTKKAGNRNIHLLWEAARGATVSGYEVFRATAPTGPFSRIAQVARTEYVDEAVEKDTTYYYKVRAFDERGLQSEYSAVVDGRTAVTPNPPVILKTESRVKGVFLVWSPGPNGTDPLRLKGYRLYRAKAEQGPYREVVIIKDSDTGAMTASLDRLLRVSHLDKGLADGEEYYYRVTAFNEKDLESGFSTPVRGTTISPPGAVKAEGERVREIRLTWNQISLPSIRGYNVYRSTSANEGFVPIKRVEPPSNPEYRVSYIDQDSLLDLTRYYYRVTAVEEGETETAPSPVVSALTRGKPPKPLLFRVVSGLVKSVDLLWAPSPTEEVVGYRIYRAREKENQFILLKTLPGRQTDQYTDGARLTFSQLEDGATYRYRMTTYNRVDVDSEPTEILSARTKPRPVKPSGVQGQSAQVKSVPLRWQPNPEKDIVLYHIYRSGETGEYDEIAQVKETLYHDGKVKDGTVYRYRIQAEDKDGLIGEFSDPVTVKTKPKPAPPEGVSGRVEEGKVLLIWRASQEPDLNHYTVYEKRLFGMEKIGVVKEARFSDVAPAAGKARSYIITATDGDGLESDPSRETQITAP